MMAVQKMLLEDLYDDPANKRKLAQAGFLLATVLNLGLSRRLINEHGISARDVFEEAWKLALELGIVAFDDWHHAPLCPANNHDRQRLPSAPCSCGAAAARLV